MALELMRSPGRTRRRDSSRESLNHRFPSAASAPTRNSITTIWTVPSVTSCSGTTTSTSGRSCSRYHRTVERMMAFSRSKVSGLPRLGSIAARKSGSSSRSRPVRFTPAAFGANSKPFSSETICRSPGGTDGAGVGRAGASAGGLADGCLGATRSQS